MLARVLLATAVLLLAQHGARADEAQARAIGFPKDFDPVREAARQEARLQGGNAAKLERDAKRWQAQNNPAAASVYSAAISARQRAAMNSVAKRRAMLARGNAQWSANNGAMAAQYRAGVNRSLGRW